MTVSLAKVHPVVVATALDHYRRRNESQDRVIGVLVGSRVNGIVEIRQAFPVAHSEQDDIAVGKDIMRELLNLHSKVTPSEVVVGWYATRELASELDEKLCLLQDFFGTETEDPLFLQIDTFGAVDINAYRCEAIEETEERVVGDFKKVKLEVVASPLTSSFLALGENNTSTIKAAISSLSKDIDSAKSALSDPNISGTSKEKLKQLLSELPSPDSPEFAKSFNKGLHDLLMVSYLSNLTKAQLAISEKLNK